MRNNQTDTLQKITLDTLNLVEARTVSRAYYLLFCVSFMFTVMRLQDFPGFTLLGMIRLPGFLVVVVGLMSISFLSSALRIFSIKVLAILLLVEAVRGVLGFFVFEDMVLNDGWHFFIWQNPGIYLFALMIPIVAIMSNGKGLRWITGVFVFMGILLGLWSLTHQGFGPGGHIGDENDLCLFLVTILPFPFFMMTYNKSTLIRGFCLTTVLFMLLGIVRTNSRGGFLGLVAVLSVFFFVSKRKGLWVMGAFIMVLAVLPFIPEEYYGEIKSIQTEAAQGGGTIEERFVTWGNIYRMWRHPSNTLFGVGLENTAWNVKYYEGHGAGELVKSLAGRAAHSFYFQVLGDLGIWGILVFGSLIFHSLRSLRKLFKKMRTLERHVRGLLGEESRLAEVPGVRGADPQGEFRRLHQLLLKEIAFVKNGTPIVFSGWFGMLAAALGISVAYYPSFWLFCALSAAFVVYGERLQRLSGRFEAVALVSTSKGGENKADGTGIEGGKLLYHPSALDDGNRAS